MANVTCKHGIILKFILSQISVHCYTMAGHYSDFYKTLRLGQLHNFYQNHVILHVIVIKYITFSWLSSDFCDYNDNNQVMSIINIKIININYVRPTNNQT